MITAIASGLLKVLVGIKYHLDHWNNHRLQELAICDVSVGSIMSKSKKLQFVDFVDWLYHNTVYVCHMSLEASSLMIKSSGL